MAHIVSIFRTPIGKRYGQLKDKTVIDLLVPLVEKAINITPNIDEFIVGCSITSNAGQNIAKQILMKSSVKTTLPTVCFQVSKVCASGIKALDLAVSNILLGKSNCILVGGVESMSNMPTYNEEKIDSLLRDGLTCSISNKIMGQIADLCAEKHSISRPNLDDYSFNSYSKYKKAYDQNVFDPIIVPLDDCKNDELFSFNLEKMKNLRPVFNQNGLHTSANSSKLADGGCIVLIASTSFIEKNGLFSIAEIISSSDFETDPESFIEAPIGCIEKLLKYSKLDKDDIHTFEVNEAFAVVPLLVSQRLEIPLEKLNPLGGAIAFGHPLGASGLIILCHLLIFLSDQQYGCISICNGGGGASGVIIRKNQFKFHKRLNLRGCRNPKIIEFNDNTLVMISSKQFKREQNKLKYLLYKDVLDSNMELKEGCSKLLDLESIIKDYKIDINISVWLRNLYFEKGFYNMIIEIKKNIDNQYFKNENLLIRTTDFETFVMENIFPFQDCFLFKTIGDVTLLSTIEKSGDFIWGKYLFNFQKQNKTFIPSFDKYVDYFLDKGHLLHGVEWDKNRESYSILFSIRNETEPGRHIYNIYTAETRDFENFKNTIKIKLKGFNQGWFCYPWKFELKGRKFLVCNQDDFGKDKEPLIFKQIL